MNHQIDWEHEHILKINRSIFYIITLRKLDRKNLGVLSNRGFLQFFKANIFPFY